METMLLKRRSPPKIAAFGVVLAGIAVLMLVTILGGLLHYKQDVGDKHVRYSSHVQTARPTGSVNANNPVQSQPAVSTSPAKVGASTRPNPTTADLPPTANQSTPAATPAASLEVSLSINGQSKGLVRLAAGNNNCSVLTQALSNGQIQSLDMRYSTEYKTEAVYVIDGIGDSAAVWWTYKVNGKLPPYGCAATSVHDGDVINWQYVKN